MDTQDPEESRKIIGNIAGIAKGLGDHGSANFKPSTFVTLSLGVGQSPMIRIMGDLNDRVSRSFLQQIGAADQEQLLLSLMWVTQQQREKIVDGNFFAVSFPLDEKKWAEPMNPQ